MKIRQDHPLLDRGKLFIFLMVVLCIVWMIAGLIKNHGTDTEQSSTLQLLFEKALEPVGSTMYVWGGGWNDEDNGGASATQIGVSPQWKEFAIKQDETYDFKDHRLEREKGLDCSGYVGWVIYNTFETESGKKGYVTASTDMAEDFANRGWGNLIFNPKYFLPGDIVSMEGHVWICLGTCEDGSVLLIHSSPPGVSICGTQIKKGESSIAIELATAFMEKYYPQWQEKYPNRIVPHTYLENVTVMRWNEETLSDAKDLQGLSGEEVLDYLKRKLSRN